MAAHLAEAEEILEFNAAPERSLINMRSKFEGSFSAATAKFINSTI